MDICGLFLAVPTHQSFSGGGGAPLRATAARTDRTRAPSWSSQLEIPDTSGPPVMSPGTQNASLRGSIQVLSSRSSRQDFSFKDTHQEDRPRPGITIDNRGSPPPPQISWTLNNRSERRRRECEFNKCVFEGDQEIMSGQGVGNVRC